MSSEEYPVHVGSPQISILGPTIFLLYINNPPDDVIWDIAIYADDTTLYSNCDRHLICGVGFNWLLNWNLWDTGVGHEVACWFQCLKHSTVFCFSFLTGLITLMLLTWEWIGLFVRKNHPLRCQGWFFLLNWIEAVTLSLLLELPPRKLKLWFVLWSFFLLKLFCISRNLPYANAWNTVVTTGLVPLVATWNW